MASKTIASSKLLLLAVALLLAASAQARAPAPAPALAPAPTPGPSQQAGLCPPGFKTMAEYEAAAKLGQGSVEFTFSGTLNVTVTATPKRPGITSCICKTATLNVSQPAQAASGNLIVCAAAKVVIP